MAGFIAVQRAEHGIPHATACRALGVSPAWFYKWRNGDASPRRARRAQLTAEIRRLFAAHRGRYGSPRITADLHEAGWRVSKNTVAKIMAEQRLIARGRRGRRGGTRPGKGRWRAPDLIGRRFAAAQVNRKWYGDGTEIVTDEGKLFLDSVLDMASRRIVGFALGEHHDAELAYAALSMAVAVRGGRDAIAGVILHTDQGSEYTAGLVRASALVAKCSRRRSSNSTVECQDSITALSSADPGRPIDWRMPSRSQAVRVSPAVYSLPWSVCRMTPVIASRPPRTATAMASAA